MSLALAATQWVGILTDFDKKWDSSVVCGSRILKNTLKPSLVYLGWSVHPIPGGHMTIGWPLANSRSWLCGWWSYGPVYSRSQIMWTSLKNYFQVCTINTVTNRKLELNLFIQTVTFCGCWIHCSLATVSVSHMTKIMCILFINTV